MNLCLMPISSSLTPIRVRGKRKLAAPLPVPPAKTRKTLQATLSSRSRRRRATLQSLPFEILESILLYSLSTSLPRASPVIGAKLSGRSTLVRLFIWAFHDTWEYSFGISRFGTCRSAEPRLQDAKCPGDPHLQTYLLHLPSVDIDFILQAQQTWVDRYARDRKFQGLVSSINKSRSDLFNVRKCFEQDYLQASQRLFHQRNSPFLFQCGTRHLHPDARLPMRLVTGPWDDEQLRRLYWLVRGGILEKAPLQDEITADAWSSFLENLVLKPPRPSLVAANCLLPVRFTFPQLPPLPQSLVRRCLAKIMSEIMSEMASAVPARNALYLNLSIWMWHLLKHVFSQDDCLLESPDFALRVMGFKPPKPSTTT